MAKLGIGIGNDFLRPQGNKIGIESLIFGNDSIN